MDEISESYALDEHGRITNPGRFEGEMAYVPYFWQIYLDGGADRNDGRYLYFKVIPEDRRRWQELKRRRTVKLYQSESSGFIYEVR